MHPEVIGSGTCVIAYFVQLSTHGSGVESGEELNRAHSVAVMDVGLSTTTRGALHRYKVRQRRVSVQALAFVAVRPAISFIHSSACRGKKL